MRASLFCLLVVIVGCLAKIDPTPLINATYPVTDKDAFITSVLAFESNVVATLDDNENATNSWIYLFDSDLNITDRISVGADCDSSLLAITNNTFVYVCSPDLDQGANITVVMMVVGFTPDNVFVVISELNYTFPNSSEVGLSIITPTDNYVTVDGLLYLIVEDFLLEQNTSLIVYNTSNNQINVLCPDVNEAAGLNASADMSLFTVSHDESAIWFLSDNDTMFIYNLTSGNFSNVTLASVASNFTNFGLFRTNDSMGFFVTEDLTFVAANFDFTEVSVFGDSVMLDTSLAGNIYSVDNKVFVPTAINGSYTNFSSLTVWELDCDSDYGFNTGFFNVTVPYMDGSDNAVIAAAWNVLIVAGYELNMNINMSMFNGTAMNGTNFIDFEADISFNTGGYVVDAYSYV